MLVRELPCGQRLPVWVPCGPWRYRHSAADKCRTNADCKAGDGCVYSWSVKHYICETETHIAPD